MSWERILRNDLANGGHLAERIEDLFAQQRATWPALGEGESALSRLRTKVLAFDGASVRVQANPGRRRSTLAKVDSQSIARRPCFLCPANMPAEERGLAFENFVILPNPYPILPRHCTVADRDHRPQRLAGSVGALLRLAAAIGPELAAFYNGPRCGASAPDHRHFQACSAAEIPLFDQLRLGMDGQRREGHRSFGRSILRLASSDAEEVRADIEQTLEELARSTETDEEPLVNLMTHYRDGRYAAVLFPRRAHRPRCYFAEGSQRLAISPAALEMAGILVVAEAGDFDRVEAGMALSIYEEVSLDRARFDELLGRLAAR